MYLSPCPGYTHRTPPPRRRARPRARPSHARAHTASITPSLRVIVRHILGLGAHHDGGISFMSSTRADETHTRHHASAITWSPCNPHTRRRGEVRRRRARSRRRAISAFPRASPSPCDDTRQSQFSRDSRNARFVATHEFLCALVSSHDTSRRRSHVSTPDVNLIHSRIARRNLGR